MFKPKYRLHEGKVLSNRSNTFSLGKAGNSLFLKYQVGKVITNFCREYSYARAGQHVTQPMLVICHPHKAGYGGHAVCPDTDPRTLCPYSLLNMVAVINAVAVCPEGKEWRLEPSGRSTLSCVSTCSPHFP